MRKGQKVKTDMFCENDPRSVAAMLRGTGDGREKHYERHNRKALLRNPELTNEDLARMYDRDARKIGFDGALRMERQRKTVAIIKSVVYNVVGVCTVLLALMYLQTWL